MTSPATALEINLSQVFTAVAAANPARPALLVEDRVVSFGGLAERADRLARFLADQGLGCFAERRELQGHQSGQHLLAQYLHNGPEYIEGLLGSYRARLAPFNVNYLYRADELLYLLNNARPAVIQYHAAFAPLLADVLARLAAPPVLLQVADKSCNELLPGANDYEAALSSVPAQTDTQPSPDDLYVIYTGGTTGMPKGVMWRQADVAVSTLGLYNRRESREWTSVAEIVAAVRTVPSRLLPCAPLMHGAAQWGVLGELCQGNTVVFPAHPEQFAAANVLEAVERHSVTVMTIVGDAFAYPLVDELEKRRWDVSSLRVLVSGGAALHNSCRNRLQELLPWLRIIENIGSSESGIQGSRHSHADERAPGDAFIPDPTTLVVAEDFGSLLPPGHDGTGWLARRGRIPLGYLGDAAKTAHTFPVVDGVRVTVPGDRARILADGLVEMLGRDSLTINTGGEKVFVEEVEAVLKDHPAVIDALVCGRPSKRWGSEVAGVVQTGPGIDEGTLLDFCRDRLARYKVPKILKFVDRVRRNPAGKGDYGWAAAMVAAPTERME